MVKKPAFKIIANALDVTASIQKNLISIEFEDNEGFESDEISLKVFGIYEKPFFGDKLELWLGWAGADLYLCGKFSVQTITIDYKAQTTEIRATAVDFASPQKEKKRRSWENTTLFAIAQTIANENNLQIKTTGDDSAIASELQNSVSDIEFINATAFKAGYLACIKNNTLIITHKDARSDEQSTSNTVKNENLPNFTLDLKDLYSLEITDANRNSYTAVLLEWHDKSDGQTKSIKVGKDGRIYKLLIAEPKSDSEAYKQAESKLNELQRNGVSGRCSTIGANIVAGGKLKFKGVVELEDTEFSIKSVSHSLSASGYVISIQFEG